MKTLKNFAKFGFLALFLSLSSCSSDEGGGGGVAAEGTITANVAGSTFTSMELATIANRVNAGGSTIVTIQGSDATGKAINLIINGATQTGTYDIGGENLIAVVGTYIETNIQNPQASKTYVAPYEDGGVAGSITISEMTDTKIVGTFNFTGKNQNDQNDSKAITNGAFNVMFD